MLVLFRIAFFAQSLLSFFALYSMVCEAIPIPFVNFLVSVFVSGIPIINIIVGFCGATSVWGWNAGQAILLFLSPYIICIFAMLFCKNK